MAVKLVTYPEITVATAGTQVPIAAASKLVYSVSIQSLSTNTGTQYVGDSNVDSSNGMPFTAGDVAEVEGPPSARGQEQFDIATIYVDSSTNNAKFRISAWTRV